MNDIVKAEGLGKRYRSRWVLQDCDLDIPAGHVTGLVGPNGAGKTTLLSLAAGMITPSAGSIEVCGGRPASGAEQLAKVGYVAQHTPTYARLSIADHLRLGAHTNGRWDDATARRRLDRLGLDLHQRAGRLSGGQRAQLALTLGLAKRPELLILDEPVARARPAGAARVPAGVDGGGRGGRLSVLLSSHVVSDLERVCDHVVVLVASKVRVEGEVDDLVATHRRLTGASRDARTLPADQHVVSESHTDVQSTFVVRTDRPVLDPTWVVGELSLEDIVLAYMDTPAQPAPRLAVAS